MAESTPDKPGWTSSAFILTAITSLTTVLGTLSGTIPPAVATIAVAVLTCCYTIANALMKKKPPVVVAPLA